MKFIIKPFSEIMVKSKPVRKRYMQMLQNNLNIKIKRIHSNLKCSLFWDKLEINLKDENDTNIINKDEVKKALKRTPGVETFLDVEKYEL